MDQNTNSIDKFSLCKLTSDIFLNFFVRSFENANSKQTKFEISKKESNERENSHINFFSSLQTNVANCELIKRD